MYSNNKLILRIMKKAIPFFDVGDQIACILPVNKKEQVIA